MNRALPSALKGIVVGAPGSGSGKTLFTLGLVAALRAGGGNVVAAKTGPDYIDAAFLGLAAGSSAINLDPWAMDGARLKSLASARAANGEMLIVEGVMGLFDGAADGRGSTADLAATLGLPVLLVVDCARQSQSVAALVSGFMNWREDIRIGGLVLNNVASPRHEEILRRALAPLRVPLAGVIARDRALAIPDRHLGLVLPGEVEQVEDIVARAARAIEKGCDLQLIEEIAASSPLQNTPGPDASPVAVASPLPPLGQHVAIARDAAFSFVYRHWLDDWRRAGAQVSFFSPLADQGPDRSADAVFLPGGYPELHGHRLARAGNFRAALREAADSGALIYGECGGYMVLGKALTDGQGKTHEMSGLLPHTTAIDRPRRVLGYRRLSHSSPLPFAAEVRGHEFHYSSGSSHRLAPLFQARDATGADLGGMGALSGRIMGSYVHVIDTGHAGHGGVGVAS